MKDKSEWKSQTLTLINNSSSIINPVQSRIINNSNEAQPSLISSVKLMANIADKDGNNKNINNAIAGNGDFYGKFQNKSDYQTSDYNFNSNEYSKDTDSNTASSSNLAHNQRRKFSPEEDIKLSRAIALQGPRKWDQIALSLPGRTGRQCRDRFHNYLNPSLTNGPWTREEDKLLEQKVYELGQHWNKIVRFFRGRSANNIKNRWYTYICKQKQSQFKTLSAKNMHKNRQEFEYQVAATNICNNYANNIFKNNCDNNDIPDNSAIKNPNNSINPILFINENKSAQKTTKSNLDDLNKESNIDNLLSKSKNEKKIFFPPISPPSNSSFSLKNQGMFNFLS